MKKLQFDVVIIGAGIAGTTAAILYAKHGKKVAIIDRKKRDAYKVNCTHFMQPAALPVIQKLGIEETIQKAKGIKNDLIVYTKHGWIRNYDKDSRIYGYNVKRQNLDPELKKVMDDNENISYLDEQRLNKIEIENDLVTGAYTQGKHGELFLEAKLFIAAGGENSKMARLLDNNNVEKVQNKRFILFAYYSGIKMETSMHWELHNRTAFAEKMENDEALISVFVDKSELDEWKSTDDLDKTFESFFDGLEKEPSFKGGQRISDFVWSVNNISYYRDAFKMNTAFVGDALMKTDPVAGTGCAFAFKSTDLLFEKTKNVLDDQISLQTGLEEYKEVHYSTFGSHFESLCEITAKDHISEDEYDFFEMIVNSKELSSSYLKMIYRLITPEEFQMHFITQLSTVDDF